MPPKSKKQEGQQQRSEQQQGPTSSILSKPRGVYNHHRGPFSTFTKRPTRSGQDEGTTRHNDVMASLQKKMKESEAILKGLVQPPAVTPESTLLWCMRAATTYLVFQLSAENVPKSKDVLTILRVSNFYSVLTVYPKSFPVMPCVLMVAISVMRSLHIEEHLYLFSCNDIPPTSFVVILKDLHSFYFGKYFNTIRC
ncbi:hypothetical protein KUTeg_019803 [Tegillarca granosa]|uniref:Uncharacterized protein n=1 Tax=Tegillarca granosa TaxID=220873 RepID=A0ABQ9EHK9_TEGGR|nr:hypothetical protein KUTeg_019803 [Tegillarca granosa]